MKTVFKYILILIIFLFALLMYVKNTAVTEYRYECKGTITDEGKTQDLTVFVKLSVFAFYTHLWGNSDGSIWLEVPNQWVESYSDLDEVGDAYHIYNNKREALKGNFSTLSKTLAISTYYGFYDGVCKAIE